MMKKTRRLLLGFLFPCFLMGVIAPAAAAAPEEPDCIYYGDYGAVGDGTTNDFDAIRQAHVAANAAALPVRADPGAVYYIPNARAAIEIKTDTDWGDARFIVDDSEIPVEDRGYQLFTVSSYLESTTVTGVESFAKGQQKLDLSLPYDALIAATNSEVTHFIRYGANANNGEAQLDVFLVDKDGRVDPTTPILWDFDNVTTMTAYPIDEETLTIKGGHFTTIANQAPWGSGYYSRGLYITRSNVVIDGVYHDVEGEIKGIGAPYHGFFATSHCANITMQNCTATGHQVVAAGSYDIRIEKSVNVTLRNCGQTNSILDNGYWGVYASNQSKNLTLDTVELSRFDAHKGVCNATIINSKLGWQGINLIGHGTFRIEDSTVYNSNFINFRSDYGSTWDGEIIIRNCVFKPRNGEVEVNPVVFSGYHNGDHDFGYACTMPSKITIDGLVIDDRNHPFFYAGPKLFAYFESSDTADVLRSLFTKRAYPYAVTEEVEIRGLEIKSGRALILSENVLRFRRFLCPTVKVRCLD